MDAVKCLKERRSVRKFSDEPVTIDKVKEIVEVARYAPSWKNTQVVRYVVVEDAAIKEKICSECLYGFEFNANNIRGAAQLIIQTYIKGRSGYEKDGSYSTSKEDRWEVYDAGIAAQSFCLAAWEQGIGSVIMGIFDEEKVAEAINLDDSQRVAALIAIGYPEGEVVQNTKRKDVNELVSVL